MKNIIFFLLFITAVMVSCEKDEVVTPEYGNYTFYTTTGGSWNLLIDGADKGLLDYSLIPPVCKDASFITVRLKEGKHTYDLKSNDGLAWGDPQEFTAKAGCYVVLANY